MGLDKQPDYRLQVAITAGALRINDALCDLYLPKSHTGPVRLHLNLSREQADIATLISQFSIEGASKHFISGRLTVAVKAENVFSLHLSTQNWGFDISETIFIADPLDLHVTNMLESISGNDQISGCFWLTPSLLLSPDKSIERSSTGEVRVTTIRAFAFTFPSTLSLTFDTEFRHSKSSAEGVVTRSELVAGFETQAELLEDMKLALSELDDLLALTSFAERRRCVCTGWDVWRPESRTRYFRRDIVIPPAKPKHTLNDALIDLNEFDSFLAQAYRVLTNSHHKDLMRQAINRAVPREGRTFESEYLTLYSALETLILLFRREHQLELILPIDQWTKFRQDLKSWMNRHTLLVDSKEKRRLIYQKANELNRVSFATAFGKFCDFYALNLADLWSITDSVKGISLSGIRNKIIHGETFGRSQHEALSVAKDHLQWTVERSLLAVLGWPFERSKVSQAFLQLFVSYKGWQAHQAGLSTIVSSAPD